MKNPAVSIQGRNSQAVIELVKAQHVKAKLVAKYNYNGVFVEKYIHGDYCIVYTKARKPDGDFDYMIEIDLASTAKKAELRMERHVWHLSKCYGVPYKIAKMIAGIENCGEAFEVLDRIRDKRFSYIDFGLMRKLKSGNTERQIDAIKEVIGAKSFAKIDCRGRKATNALARYLAGEAV